MREKYKKKRISSIWKIQILFTWATYLTYFILNTLSQLTMHILNVISTLCISVVLFCGLLDVDWFHKTWGLLIFNMVWLLESRVVENNMMSISWLSSISFGIWTIGKNGSFTATNSLVNTSSCWGISLVSWTLSISNIWCWCGS